LNRSSQQAFSPPNVGRLVDDTIGVWKRITNGVLSAENAVELHANILYPDIVDEDKRCEIKAEISRRGADADTSNKFAFKLSSPRATEAVVMDLAKPIDVEGLHSSAIVVICKLAFCFHFKEPCILRGPTCFKSHCVKTLADALDIANSSRKMNTLHLSQLTEHNDLVGGIEPHTKQSFSEYIAHLLPMVASGMSDFQHSPVYEVDQVSEKLRLLTAHPSAPPSVKKWCADRMLQLENDFAPQGFPFCERGIVSSVHHGGVLLLKDLNLPDQAVTESLNSLTELCPSFRSGPENEPVTIHDQFHVVATVHEPSTLNPLSPAILSRFTEIRIAPPTTNDIAEFKEAWSPLLTRYMRSKYENAKLDDASRDALPLLVDLPRTDQADNSLPDFVEYMFGLLSVIQGCMPSVLKQVTLRTMLQWADYIVLRRIGSDQYKVIVIESLVIGGHMLLLDKIKSGLSKDALLNKVYDFEQNLMMRDKSSWKVFRYGTLHLTRDPRDQDDCGSNAIQSGYLRHWRLHLGSTTDDPVGSFVLSPTAVANVARIICARDTGHPICLVGPPGIGKSKVVEISAKVRIAALYASTTYYSCVGWRVESVGYASTTAATIIFIRTHHDAALSLFSC
jgi:hypothetical protein